MELIHKIRTSQNFKLALWSRHYEASDPSLLFEICCSSLIYDSNNLPIRGFSKGETVELLLKYNSELKRLYLKYLGEDTFNEIKRIILTNDDEKGKITFKLDASQFVWRLNKCTQDKKLTSNNQLKKYPILNPPVGINNPIRILAKKINIPYSNFNFFERTYLLVLLKQPIDDVISALKNWHYNDHSFFDFFPAYYCIDENTFRKINTEKFDRSEPERIIYFFSDQTVLLDFINNADKQKHFFLISNNFNRFFNPATFQYLFQTINQNNEQLKIIYFGDIGDFKKLNYELNLPLIKITQPILDIDEEYGYKEIKNNVQRVGNRLLDKSISEFLLIAKKYKDLNPAFSSNLRKIIYDACSLDKYMSDQFRNYFDKFVYEYGRYIQLEELKQLIHNFEDNNYKNVAMDDGVLVTNISMDSENKGIIDKKEFKTQILSDIMNSKYILTFIDSYFFNDFLFPALLLGYVKPSQLKFRLYELEKNILLNSLKEFNKKCYDIFGSAFLAEAEKDEESKEALEEHIKLFELDLSTFNNHYTPSEGGKLVEAITVLSEDDNQEYISFFSKNYSPTIIENDSAFDITISELEVGHEIIIIPGVRNILQKFSEVFEKKEIKIELKNKWKDALNNFIETNSFSILKKQLNRLGLNRTEATIRNWINNSSVIGTLHPKEDFLIIAKATNDSFLLNNYMEVAEVCNSLQRMSKIIGKRIKKLSLAVLRGQSISSYFNDYDSNTRIKIESMLHNIKVVTVTNIYHEPKEVDVSLVNQLLARDKI